MSKVEILAHMSVYVDGKPVPAQEYVVDAALVREVELNYALGGYYHD